VCGRRACRWFPSIRSATARARTKSHAQIADRLVLFVRTVETHLYCALNELA
jgi:DNA-binding NarL/FixJ family response regulator